MGHERERSERSGKHCLLHCVLLDTAGRAEAAPPTTGTGIVRPKADLRRADRTPQARSAWPAAVAADRCLLEDLSRVLS
jgi:hypothetical protein